jgi:hypothetical protein
MENILNFIDTNYYLILGLAIFSFLSLIGNLFYNYGHKDFQLDREAKRKIIDNETNEMDAAKGKKLGDLMNQGNVMQGLDDSNIDKLN